MELINKQVGTVFEYIAILIIYIYAFVYLGKEETEITSIALLFITHIIFIFYCFVKTRFVWKVPRMGHTHICIFGLHISNLFLFVSLTLFTRLLYRMDAKFKKITNEPIVLPKKYEDIFDSYKKLFIACFSLLFVLFIGLTLLYPLINKSIDLSFSGLRNINNIIPLFFVLCSLASIGMSSYMIYQGNEFLKFSRRQIIE